MIVLLYIYLASLVWCIGSTIHEVRHVKKQGYVEGRFGEREALRRKHIWKEWGGCLLITVTPVFNTAILVLEAGALLKMNRGIKNGIDRLTIWWNEYYPYGQHNSK